MEFPRSSFICRPLTDDAPGTCSVPMLGAIAENATGPASVVVVQDGSTEAVRPTHTMTGQLHIDIVVDGIGYVEESQVLDIVDLASYVLKFGGIHLIVVWIPQCCHFRDPVLLYLWSLVIEPVRPLFDRERDFRGLPSESLLDESSISSGSLSELLGLSLD